MSTIHVNLAELQKAAMALQRSSAALANEAKNIGRTTGGLSSVRVAGADRVRAEMDQVARALTRQADAASKGAQVLRKLAADLQAVTGS